MLGSHSSTKRFQSPMILLQQASRDSDAQFNTRLSTDTAESGFVKRARAKFRKQRAVSDLTNPNPLFADVHTAKSAALRRICAVDKWASLYRSDICLGQFANSSIFTNMSTLLVLANTLWIAIETDNAGIGRPDGFEGAWLVSIDSIFCALFLIEWIIRFGSLKRRRFLMLDGWLVFDTFLLLINVTEAWIMPAIDEEAWEDGAGPLGVLRMLRLSRIARTVELFRLVPELSLLIRSITQALRAVFAVMCLLVLFVYVNALYFTGLARGTALEHTLFPDVGTSMKRLLVHGTLLDGISWFIDQVAKESVVLTVLFVLFVFVTACLLLNMLIGVMVEVVNVTASVEQEEKLAQFVMSALAQTLENIGHDGRRYVTKKQFERIARQGAMNEVLRVLNINLDKKTLLEYIFASEGEVMPRVRVPDIVLTLLQLRSTSQATVRDILESKRIVLQRIAHLEKVVKEASPLMPTTLKRSSLKMERGFSMASQGDASEVGSIVDTHRTSGGVDSGKVRDGWTRQLQQEFVQMALGKLHELEEQVQRDLQNPKSPTGLAVPIPGDSANDDGPSRRSTHSWNPAPAKHWQNSPTAPSILSWDHQTDAAKDKDAMVDVPFEPMPQTAHQVHVGQGKREVYNKEMRRSLANSAGEEQSMMSIEVHPPPQESDRRRSPPARDRQSPHLLRPGGGNRLLPPTDSQDGVATWSTSTSDISVMGVMSPAAAPGNTLDPTCAPLGSVTV